MGSLEVTGVSTFPDSSFLWFVDSLKGSRMEDDDSNDGENSRCFQVVTMIFLHRGRTISSLRFIGSLAMRRGRRSRGNEASDKRKSQLQKIRFAYAPSECQSMPLVIIMSRRTVCNNSQESP